jgi:hypothetical protein
VSSSVKRFGGPYWITRLTEEIGDGTTQGKGFGVLTA